MPKFKPANSFTKSFKKKSPFEAATTTGGMDLGTSRMDRDLVSASNQEVLSRKASEVQEGIAESDKTRLFGLQAYLTGQSKSMEALKETLGGTNYAEKKKEFDAGFEEWKINNPDGKKSDYRKEFKKLA
jgi:hypothetical protein